MPEGERTSLTWQNVTCTVFKNKEDTEGKRILNDVAGAVRPGETCAIMGPSGLQPLKINSDSCCVWCVWCVCCVCCVHPSSVFSFTHCLLSLRCVLFTLRLRVWRLQDGCGRWIRQRIS